MALGGLRVTFDGPGVLFLLGSESEKNDDSGAANMWVAPKLGRHFGTPEYGGGGAVIYTRAKRAHNSENNPCKHDHEGYFTMLATTSIPQMVGVAMMHVMAASSLMQILLQLVLESWISIL